MVTIGPRRRMRGDPKMVSRTGGMAPRTRIFARPIRADQKGGAKGRENAFRGADHPALELHV
jgi:hypothetical protein